MSAFQQWVSTTFRALFNDPTPIVKQSATVVGVGIAIVATVTVPGLGFSNDAAAASGVLLIAIATAVAAWFTVSPQYMRYALLIPAVDIIGIGLFRAGTGGTASLFAALVLLPVVWLAAADGRRYILYSGVGTSFALMLPYIIAWQTPTTGGEWLRGVFTPAVFMTAAVIINEIARQARARTAEALRLADANAVELRRSIEFARELQKSEAKYASYQRMFRGVWAAVTEQSVIGTDATGLIDAWNPGATRLLGPTAEQAEKRLRIDDFHLRDELDNRSRELSYPPGETVLNPGFSALVETARSGVAEVREWTYVRADGTTLPVELSVTKRLDENGETAGYLFVASDLTRSKEVARLKDEFVGLISHELRTPLSSILGYLELMRDDEDHPLTEEQLQYLGVAERNAHRLLRLVGDLLFTAQVESGKFPLDLHDLELHDVLDASVQSARPAAEAKGIRLTCRVPEDSVVVRADSTRIGQAVDNLVSNALKFTPRGGEVTVTLRTEGASAVVSVRDTGMGIPASELDQLFSRFFRATTATRNAVPGVGLGLTITKAIVIAHLGDMDVHSEEGVGTEFEMTLPLAATLDTLP